MRHKHITIEQARDTLKSHAWTTPQYYAGFSPIGDYCILTRRRDSDSLEESNWEVAPTELPAEREAYDGGTEHYADRGVVYDWRASHSMVGWVEYLMVRQDAPDDVLIAAANIVQSLDDYPILDEEHWSTLETRHAEESWQHLDLRGRLEVIEGARYDGKPISMFAIRHDYPPGDDQGLIQERLI